MRRAVIPLLGLLALATASPSAAGEPITLWRGLKTGMTIAEVRRRVPEARPNKTLGAPTEPWVDLLKGRVRDRGRDEQVIFQFTGERLVGVIVAWGEPYGLPRVAPGEPERIRAEVEKTEGAPIRCREMSDGFKACFWLRDGLFTGYFERLPPTPAVALFRHAERPGDRDLLLD